MKLYVQDRRLKRPWYLYQLGAFLFVSGQVRWIALDARSYFTFYLTATYAVEWALHKFYLQAAVIKPLFNIILQLFSAFPFFERPAHEHQIARHGFNIIPLLPVKYYPEIAGPHA